MHPGSQQRLRLAYGRRARRLPLTGGSPAGRWSAWTKPVGRCSKMEIATAVHRFSPVGGGPLGHGYVLREVRAPLPAQRDGRHAPIQNTRGTGWSTSSWSPRPSTAGAKYASASSAPASTSPSASRTWSMSTIPMRIRSSWSWISSTPTRRPHCTRPSRRRGQTLGRPAGDPLHAQAWQLAEHGRDRTERVERQCLDRASLTAPRWSGKWRPG